MTGCRRRWRCSITSSDCAGIPTSTSASSEHRPRLAVTVGDPRGIGPEVIERALTTAPLDADVTLIGPEDLIGHVPGVRCMGLGAKWRDAASDNGAAAGRLAARGIELAVRLAREGVVDAVVTGPVHKQALHLAGYRYPGVTELLGRLSGDQPVAMMLVVDRLRVVLITTHLPLREVPAAITLDRVVGVGRIAVEGLRRWWRLTEPRLAVCALNPHAGEGGLFGDEEDRVLRPAAEALGATGPLPADTVFVRALRGEFDAVLVPVHDVGMTAVKVAGFGRGVNVTLGLPFVRTSPDHGTAFDIAGRGVADAGSMRAALELATELAGAR